MKKALMWLGVTLSVIALSYFISPKNFKSACSSAKGTVSSVYADAKKKVHLRLKGDRRNYLLQTQKLNIATLEQELLGKDVMINYRDSKLALNTVNEGEIASIVVNEHVLYSE